MKGLIEFQKLYILSIYLLILFLFILTYLFLFFIRCFLFCRWFNTVFISKSTSHINFFLKLSIHKRCIVTSYKFLSQGVCLLTILIKLISQKIVVLIRVVLQKSKFAFLRLDKKSDLLNFLYLL